MAKCMQYIYFTILEIYLGMLHVRLFKLYLSFFEKDIWSCTMYAILLKNNSHRNGEKDMSKCILLFESPSQERKLIAMEQAGS